MKGALSAWIRIATDLLDRYTADIPFHHYLKHAFARDRRMGSRDRRMIRACCYALLRGKGALVAESPAEFLAAALYLSQPDVFVQIRQDMNEDRIASLAGPGNLSLQERTAVLRAAGIRVNAESLFTESIPLSDGVGLQELRLHQWQPLPVWVRIRPGTRDLALRKIADAGLIAEIHPRIPDAISFPAHTALERAGILEDGLAEVQDIGSQLTLDFSDCHWEGHWLDACAGGGGKSLLLLDRHPGIHLSVSDVRDSALRNLVQRMERAGHSAVQVVQADFTTAQHFFEWDSFNGIIADVPCSGSGTWARTPEDRHRFKAETLCEFTERQVGICRHLVRYLSPGGYLIYITCSVFRAENEDVTHILTSSEPLELVSQKLMNGSQLGGDYLYAALLKKKGL